MMIIFKWFLFLKLCAAESLQLDEESFTLFDTQMYEPSAEVINVGSQEDSAMRKADNMLTSELKKKLNVALEKTPSGKKLPTFENLESDEDEAFDKIAKGNDSSDTDDFVAPPPKNRSGLQRKVAPVRKKNDAAVKSANVISNKRPTRRPLKWSGPVEVLKPVVFQHIQKARLLRDFILSKHAREMYGM